MRTVSLTVTLGLAIAAVAVATVAPPAGAADLPTVRVSRSGTGGDPNGHSDRPHLSGSGRFVAFDSVASNLVADDTNRAKDAFLFDATTGTTTRVSVGTSGEQANDASTLVSIGFGGRYVAYESLATNLVPSDTNAVSDVFLRDLQDGVTTRVSVASDGTQGDGFSTRPAMSADGRYIAFNSAARNLVSGDTNGAKDVFVRDLVAGTTERVSLSSTGQQGNATSIRPEISADGRYVAFVSDATNLVPNDANGARDVFVHDRETRQTLLVSMSTNATSASHASSRPSISPDGRYVAFQSRSSDLVNEPWNGKMQVYLRDLAQGTTKLISANLDGLPSKSDSSRGVVSDSGLYVAFNSFSADLIPSDTNSQGDAFVRDVQSGTTRRVSVNTTGAGPNGWSYRPEISADGRWVAYRSSASDVVFNDNNGAFDIFLVDTAALGDDTIPPDATVTTPTAGEVLADPATFLGQATDNVAVGGVDVAVKDVATNLWLHPDGSWGRYIRQPATLSSPGASSTDWSFTATLPDGEYALQVIAVDGVGNEDPDRPWVRFAVTSDGAVGSDEQPPDATVTSPTHGEVMSNPVVATGNATDDVAVSAVDASVRDVNAGLWLQADGTWSSSYARLPTELSDPDSPETAWSFTVELPAGDYALAITAVDAAGNTDPDKPWIRFSVTAPPDKKPRGPK